MKIIIRNSQGINIENTINVESPPVLYFEIYPIAHRNRVLQSPCDVVKVTKNNVLVDKYGDGYSNSINRVISDFGYGYSYSMDTGYMELTDNIEIPFKSIIEFDWGNDSITLYDCISQNNKIHFNFWSEIIHNTQM